MVVNSGGQIRSGTLSLLVLRCAWPPVEPSREGTEAFVVGCSGFLCGSGAKFPPNSPWLILAGQQPDAVSPNLPLLVGEAY